MAERVVVTVEGVRRRPVSPDRFTFPYLWSNPGAGDEVLIRQLLVQSPNYHDLRLALKRYGSMVRAQMKVLDDSGAWPNARHRAQVATMVSNVEAGLRRADGRNSSTVSTAA